MLKKFVIVGLGGSGGKTVRTTHAAIDRQLRSKGWTRGVPQGWQFIHVDVPAAPDGLDPELPLAIPGTYHGLVTPGTSYGMVDRSLEYAIAPEIALRATSGWRPDPRLVGVPIDLGAGQYRALGRVVTVQNLEVLSNALEHALSRVTFGTVEGELREVARLLGGDADNPMDTKAYVFIVSSMAGGSGAGMLVDAIEVTAAQPGSNAILSWVYAPDVFDDLPAHARQGVRPNALATLMELTNAAWNNEGLPYSGALFQARGVSVAVQDVNNPRPVLLIGRTNGSVTFPDQNSIYSATGRAIASLIFSERATDDLTAYSITNRQMNTPTTDRMLLKDPTQKPPFQAFGFARVSLGRDIFSDYAAEWLARAAAETLLRKHEQERGINDERTDEEVINSIVERTFLNFVVNCTLDEHGPNNNQVIDNIHDAAGATQRYDELVGALTSEVRAAFPRPAASAQITLQIASSAGSKRLRFAQDQATLRLQVTTRWVQEIQRTILAAVADSMSRYGLPVTVRMLQKLVAELVPAILDDLRGEAAEFSRWAGDVNGVVFNELAAAPAAFPATHPAVDQAVTAAANCLWSEVEADRRRAAMELLEDLRDGYLTPLLDALRNALAILQSEDRPQGGVPSAIRRWPEGTHIPIRFRPALNEFLLVDTAEFSTIRERLIINSIPGMEGLDAVNEAVVLVAHGKAQADDQVQALEQSRSWVPVNTKVRAPQLAPQQARFASRVRADDLLANARGWMSQPDRAMGKYVSQSLRHFLSDPTMEEGERIKRGDRLTAQLAAAIRAAQPLVSINPRMVQEVHGQDALGTELVFSEIPVAGLGEVEQKVNTTLVNVLGSLAASRYSKSLTDSQAADIEIYTMTQPGEALVFESVIGPIAEEWFAAAPQKMTKDAFWLWRRSRPLTEFVPLSPRYRRAFVRGWFTARIMGTVETRPGSAVRVKDDDGAWLSFPYPLLWDAPREYDTLAAVLKSIAIAWLDARRRASIEPLQAYYRLIRLGMREGDPEGYNQEFGQWLQASPANRESAKSLVDKLSESYAPVLSNVRDPLRSPRVFELEEDLTSALTALHEQASEDLGQNVF